MARRLTTERMILEPMDERHFEFLARLRADPEVMKFRYGGPESEERTGADLQEYRRTWENHEFGVWALLDKATGTFLGEGGLFIREDGRGIALRFAFFQFAWGQGLASEFVAAALEYGFSEVGLPRIVAVAQEANSASRRVMEKAGLVLEDTFENQGVRLVLYAIQRPP